MADLFRIQPASLPEVHPAGPAPATVAHLLEYVARVRTSEATGGMAMLTTMPAYMRRGVLAKVARQTRTATRTAVVTAGNMVRLSAHADRGEVLAAIWAQAPSHPAWQSALSVGWIGGSAAVVAAAGSRARLIQWFDAAEAWAPLPFLSPHLVARHEMPEHVEVFRGGLLDTNEPLAGGYSWTSRETVASLYASLRTLEHGGRPGIIRALVPREAIMLRTRTRDDEIVLIEPIAGAEVHLVDRDEIERLAATEAAGRSCTMPSEILHLDRFQERCWCGWVGD